MIALVAAAGGARQRFDDFGVAAAAVGARVVESTPAGAAVRIGVVVPVGTEVGAIGVLTTAAAGERCAVALGSGVRGRSWSLDALARLDGLPEDVAVIAADAAAGALTLRATAGSHRVFAAEWADGVVACTQLGLLARALAVGPTGGPAGLRLDRSYEDFLLGFGFLPDGRTCYEGVRACRPAPRARRRRRRGWRAAPPRGRSAPTAAARRPRRCASRSRATG